MMEVLAKIILSALILVLCANASAAENEADAPPIVQTNNGAIRGKVLRTVRQKKTYYSFKGVPYATPPSGELRFRVPQKVADWSPRVLDATEFGYRCVQSSKFWSKEPESEDCLFLNIFTPDLTPNAKLPVIFYIHGGGFIEGSSNQFGPDFLIERDTIVVSYAWTVNAKQVTINYRNGVFGFLSLGLPEFSGNMALKDQQVALEWVYENIHHFGGDKQLISIAGHSTGSACVHFHTLSERSRKYFSTAMVMGGVALNRWAVSEKDHHEDLFKMYAIANDLGQKVSNIHDLIEFLQRIPADILLKYTSNTEMIPLEGKPKTTVMEWNIVIESPDAQMPFLTAEPEYVIKNSVINVTTMFGFTTKEWLFFAGSEVKNPALLRHFNENFRMELPFRGCKLDYESREYQLLAADVRDYFFGRDSIDNANSLSAYLDMLSDVFFFYHINKAVQLHANAGKTYYFRFSVDSDFNFRKVLQNIRFPGTEHVADMCYAFRCTLLGDKYQELLENQNGENTVAYRAVNRVSQLWSNFAKYGIPIVENELADVKQVTENNLNIFDLSDEGFSTVHNPIMPNVYFWEQLFEKYKKILDRPVRKDRVEL